jgi:hypothetical protein
MTEFVTLAKKYGGFGVIAIWLFMTNKRVDILETELQACNDSRVNIYRELTRPITKRQEENRLPLLAIITQPITLKNIEDERS